MTTTGKNQIMIFGPKTDGTYVVEFRTAAGEALAISIPRTDTDIDANGKVAEGFRAPIDTREEKIGGVRVVRSAMVAG
jgi:hypothetical protein